VARPHTSSWVGRTPARMAARRAWMRLLRRRASRTARRRVLKRPTRPAGTSPGRTSEAAPGMAAGPSLEEEEGWCCRCHTSQMCGPAPVPPKGWKAYGWWCMPGNLGGGACNAGDWFISSGLDGGSPLVRGRGGPGAEEGALHQAGDRGDVLQASPSHPHRPHGERLRPGHRPVRRPAHGGGGPKERGQPVDHKPLDLCLHSLRGGRGAEGAQGAHGSRRRMLRERRATTAPAARRAPR